VDGEYPLIDRTVFVLTPEGYAALDDWPENGTICLYLLCALAASYGDDPRPLDSPGTVVRAKCLKCDRPTDHELRQGPPGPRWHSVCLSCEGRSYEGDMCNNPDFKV